MKILRRYLLTILMILVPSLNSVAGDPGRQPGKNNVDAQAADDGKKRVVKGYNLGSLRYPEIQEMLQNIKSPAGSISYIKANHRILVVDIPSVHKQVQNLLTAGRGPIVNVTIDVEFQNTQASEERGIKLNWTYDDGSAGRARAAIGDGKIEGPSGVTIRPRDRKTTQSRYTKQSIMTLSGKPAQLWVTETVLDKAALQRYELIPFRIIVDGDRVVINEGYQPEIITRELGSSLWVLPTYMENGLVHVEVFPVVSYETENGGEQSFRMEKVNTTVVVKPGTRFYLGGSDKNLRGFMRDLFGSEFSKSGTTDSLSMYLTPHIKVMNSPKDPKQRSGQERREGMWRHFPD